VAQQIFLLKPMHSVLWKKVAENVDYFCNFKQICPKEKFAQTAKIRPIWSHWLAIETHAWKIGKRCHPRNLAARQKTKLQD
jgi:hypothetical protein